jgi:hypothetical protein
MKGWLPGDRGLALFLLVVAVKNMQLRRQKQEQAKAKANTGVLRCAQNDGRYALRMTSVK